MTHLEKVRENLQLKRDNSEEASHTEESELNELFHCFSKVMLEFAYGQNTVASQRSVKDHESFKTKGRITVYMRVSIK